MAALPLTSTPASTHEKLVSSLVALGAFLDELRSAAGPDEILIQTVHHLKTILPIKVAGFYCPGGPDNDFVLRTPMEAAEAAELNGLVEQAIDSGVFGWALNHSRPSAFRTPDGGTTLILSALRTRQRALGLFAAILSIPSASGWDGNAIVLATHLACAAESFLNEQLTLELQDHNRKLDSLVLQRTQELLEAKEAAELANRTKSVFLATVSHELRTPLNAILGYTQILLTDSLAPDHHDQIATIHQAGEHLLGLINDILDISKAEAAAIEIIPAQISIPQLIDETAAIIRPRAEEKGLHFQCTTDVRLPQTITADRKRLKQILLNLLSNATKFTDRGFVHLAVSRKPGCIRFLVSDTGSGIAAQDLPRLFQPFQQLGNSGRHTEGTGLGLSVCKRILDVLGVELLVRSELGKGSSFWFELPCDFTEAKSAPSLATSPQPALPNGPSPYALVVLSRTVLEALKELAANGDVLGLQRELKTLLAESPATAPLTSRLLQLASQCRMKAVREALEEYERNHSAG